MILNIIISVIAFVNIFFLVAVIRKNFAIMDIAWGLGFILIAMISYLHYPISFKNAVLLMVTVTWGLRLAMYIFRRGKGKPEDRRYANLREEWKPHENIQAWIKVFMFQGVLMMIVSLPISAGMALESKNFSVINYIGLLIWLTGFSLEVVSDHYLAWWKLQEKNKGKICTEGPWRLCRFPNYFGEVLLWYGVYLLAFEVSIFWTIIGPITINFLILKVTGVPLLEEHYKNREDYKEYASRVPRFIPFTK